MSSQKLFRHEESIQNGKADECAQLCESWLNFPIVGTVCVWFKGFVYGQRLKGTHSSVVYVITVGLSRPVNS